ncbi:hypothetical protein ACXX82_04530 [Glaciimonas sp. GNP009]
MQLIVLNSFPRRRMLRTRFYQIALWCAVAILVAQLIGIAFHRHSLLEESRECVSCNLAVHVPAPPSLLPLMALVPMLVFVYHLAPDKAHFFALPLRGYLTPHSHAPPQFYSRS